MSLICRSYINQRRGIKVGIYDDMVNIVSLGCLPNTLTQETLMDGYSEIRNRVIGRVFKELGYIEQWGSGIARIKSACKAQGLAEPRIREKGDFVDVAFYRPVLNHDQEVPDIPEIVPDTVEAVPDTAPSQVRAILAHIGHHGHITTPEVARLLVVKDRRARAVLKNMMNQGLIEKRGSARQTVYG
jgi:ATP-dependent DNA helicase RecG